jgi:FMN reductase
MAASEQHIHIAIIKGSVRPNNYTSMAAALVEDELRKQGVAVRVIDPSAYNLPLPGIDPQAAGPRRLQADVKDATGIVFATPEYHGGLSSVSKLVIDNLGYPSALAGKPVALLGVAAGGIGAIKALEQLRSILAHIGAIALPMPVSVANVQKAFDTTGKILDPSLEKLIRGVATNLLHYIESAICPRVTLERLLREGVEAVTS